VGALLWWLVVLAVLVTLLRAWADRRALAHLPYRRKPYLLTHAERIFFEVLRRAAGGEFYVCPMVRLADVIEVPPRAADWWTHFNRVKSKHLDFVVCSQGTLSPILAFELDDRSHERADRVARDQFVNAALTAAELPLVRMSVQRAYAVDEIRQIIRDHVVLAGSLNTIATSST